MLLILGKEYCKIDSNGRFKFPVALKRQLETDDGRFVIRQSLYAKCLELWTYESFRAEVEGLQKMLNPYNKEDREMLRKLTEGNIVELDSNDRMLIPTEQKSVLQKSKEIVLQSTGKFIEIWDYDQYQEMNAQTADMSERVDARLGNGSTIEAHDGKDIS
ncbi:MAG: hypothetical protein K5867_03705 [Bacteroidales bacterium]|jgi:division/cell wall cluster transcriptional repressor MraZ|nr:hypothetical protein [Bacteroidales bacterium]